MSFYWYFIFVLVAQLLGSGGRLFAAAVTWEAAKMTMFVQVILLLHFRRPRHTTTANIQRLQQGLVAATVHPLSKLSWKPPFFLQKSNLKTFFCFDGKIRAEPEEASHLLKKEVRSSSLKTEIYRQIWQRRVLWFGRTLPVFESRRSVEFWSCSGQQQQTGGNQDPATNAGTRRKKYQYLMLLY